MKQAVSRLLACMMMSGWFATPAAAQNDPRFALLTSFPNPTISFQYDVNDRFAARVETTFTYRDEASDGPSGGIGIGFGPTSDTTTRVTRVESQTHSGSIGFASIITLHRADQFRLYVAPRVAVTFSKQSATFTERLTRTRIGFGPNSTPEVISITEGEPEIVRNSSASPSGGASIGAAVDVHRRLALFGEAGFTYARRDGRALLSASTARLRGESEVTTANTRAVGGLMFRF